MRDPVVLVVDDEALLRMLAADYFADAGFEVVEAASGAQALSIMRDRPDIKALFTDVQMPGDPDGYELSRIAREINARCAIVVVSGRTMPQIGDLASRARFLQKPYNGEDVVGLIRELLAA